MYLDKGLATHIYLLGIITYIRNNQNSILITCLHTKITIYIGNGSLRSTFKNNRRTDQCILMFIIYRSLYYSALSKQAFGNE